MSDNAIRPLCAYCQRSSQECRCWETPAGVHGVDLPSETVPESHENLFPAQLLGTVMQMARSLAASQVEEERRRDAAARKEAENQASATASKKAPRKRAANTATSVRKKQKTNGEVISDSLHLPHPAVFGVGPSAPAPAPATSLSETGSSTGRPAPSRPVYSSLVRKSTRLDASKRGASDVWWFMYNLDGATKESPVPSHDELKRQPRNRCKPSSKTVPFLACRFCPSCSRKWKNSEGMQVTIREHLVKYHYLAWREEVIRNELKGYENLCGTTSPTSTASKNAKTSRPKSYPPGSFTLGGFILRLVRWLVVDDQAPNVVDSPELRDLFLYLNASLRDRDIPKRTRIVKLIFVRFEVEYTKMVEEFKNSLGRISFTSDVWTDPDLTPYMAMTGHAAVKDSKGQLVIRSRLVAFRHLPGSHTGEHIANNFLQVIRELEAIHKIGVVTLDNASNNDTMMASLEIQLRRLGIPFDKEGNRIRCFPHVVNIAVQTALKTLSASSAETSTDTESLEDQGSVLPPLDISHITDSGYAQALSRDPIQLLRSLINDCRASSQRREDFLATIDEGNRSHAWAEGKELPVAELLRDMEVRWSSTYLMIDRALELYQAIDCFLNKSKQRDISCYNLTSDDLRVLADIRDFLAIPHDVQQLLSNEKTPTLPNVLPAYEELLSMLKDSVDDFPHLSQAIEAAVSKIEEYVGKARKTRAYALAIAINPTTKFKWISEHWSAGDALQAEKWLKESMLEYKTSLRQTGATSNSSSHEDISIESPTRASRITPTRHRASRPPESVASGMLQLKARRDARRSSSQSIPGSVAGSASSQEMESFDDYMASVTPSRSHTPLTDAERAARAEETERKAREADEAIVEAEFARWKAHGVIEDAEMLKTFDLLRFWTDNEYNFSLMYRVAVDVLPMQASSVPCERVFSSSKLTTTARRNKLSPALVEVLQILKYIFKQERLDFSGSWAATEADMLAADRIPSGDAKSMPTTVTEKLTNCKPQQITDILGAIEVVVDDVDSEWEDGA